MARLKISDTYIQAKDNVGNIGYDLKLYEIDLLTTTLGKDFESVAYKNNCISEGLYKDKEKRIVIECNGHTLKPVFFDERLKKVAASLNKSRNDMIDSNLDSLKEDIQLFKKMLEKDHSKNKIKKYFEKDIELINIINNKETDMLTEHFKHYYNYRNLRSYLRENTYYLAVTLDSENKKYSILYEDDKGAVDDYTMSFVDSNQVREKYKIEIHELLEANKDYIKKCSRVNNGYVVVLRNDEYGLVREKVLYKGTKKILNDFTKNSNQVKELSKIDYANSMKGNENPIFSQFENKKIYLHRDGKRDGYATVMKNWVSEIQNKKDYDLARTVLHFIKYGFVLVKTNNVISKNDMLCISTISSKEEIDEKEEFFYDEEIEMIKGSDQADYNHEYQIMKKI